MRSNLYIIVVLTVIASLSGGILSFWDRATTPVIKENKRIEFEKSLKEVLPPYNEVVKSMEGDVELYRATVKGETVAYAVKTHTNGFQSRIELLYSVSADRRRILKLMILEQMETPGLGTKIADDPSRKDSGWFAGQFSEREPTPEILYVKNRAPAGLNEVEAITGATISSRAVVGQVNRSLGSGVWQK